MKANELQIGDWVFSNSPRDNIKKVSKITLVNTNTLVRTTNNSQGTLADYLEPIPLTPEILEKNGFEYKPAPHWITDKDKEKDYYLQKIIDEIVDEYYVSCRYFHKVGETILDISTNNRIGFNGVIQYVHQLQHALRLCGIEKEITL